jgi:hypothetical protein
VDREVRGQRPHGAAHVFQDPAGPEAGATVTAVFAVRSDHYNSKCGGGVSSRQWLKITAINGKSVKSLYGRSYAYVAKGLFKLAPAPARHRPLPRRQR